MSWAPPPPTDLHRKAMPRHSRRRQTINVVAIFAGVVLLAFAKWAIEGG